MQPHLPPFEIRAEENSIVHALHPAPVALRHVIGHMVPDAVYNALDQLLPGLVPAEGADVFATFRSASDQEPMRLPPDHAVRAEVLTFNSGGAGARPTLDGMNATAFPSGVMTMPVEATEQVGPVIIWRKELRPDSGGAGQYRGGLGQFMDVGARQGHEFDISAMFDRTAHPARGRQGGEDGAPTTIARSDGSAMRGKGRQFVPHGQVVQMAFPGGAGYGKREERKDAEIARDLALGYISRAFAADHYNWPDEKIEDVLKRAAKEVFK